jgi:hypothetical protein
MNCLEYIILTLVNGCMKQGPALFMLMVEKSFGIIIGFRNGKETIENGLAWGEGSTTGPGRMYYIEFSTQSL